MGTVVPEDHPFVTPNRAVTSMSHMDLWFRSKAYVEYENFILVINEAMKGKPLAHAVSNSEVIMGLVTLLNTIDKWIEEIPPLTQAQRFGNQAFRTWHARLKERAMELLQAALPRRFHRAVPEIMVYLVEGFGNATRIDYGTGHEMSFLMFLCCLFKIGALTELDQISVIGHVFKKYLQMVRNLQVTYRMEPAGSRGVWSLDDYQFVPFIWGSSQLIAHPRIEPKSFLQEDVIETYSEDYLFIGCIKFINKVKTGLFAEHSNQLWNVSGVPSWAKVNAGLIKMYRAEVLAKFPVIQHVLFGSLMSIDPVPVEPYASRPSAVPKCPSAMLLPQQQEQEQQQQE